MKLSFFTWRGFTELPDFPFVCLRVLIRKPLLWTIRDLDAIPFHTESAIVADKHVHTPAEELKRVQN